MHERETYYERHPDPMWVYDFDTLQFLDVNEAAIAVYGYSRAEFLAMDVREIRPAEDVPQLLEDIAEARAGRNAPRVCRHLKKSGELLFVHVVARSVDWQGRRARLVSVRDITLAVQAEQARETLLAREASLRSVAEAAAAQFERLFSAVPGNMLVLSPGDWTVLAVSDALLDAARVEKAAFLGRPLFEALPDSGETPQAVSLLQLRASLQQVIDTGEPDQPGVLYYPVPVRSGDANDAGHRLWIAVNTPVKAADGTISYVMCTLEDVTTIIAGAAARGTSFEIIEQARRAFPRHDLPYLRTTMDLRSAMARLAEQNANLRTAQRLIRMGAWKFGLETGRLVWSPEVLDMYGVAEADFGGSFDAYAALVHPDDREAMTENYRAFARSGELVFEFAHRAVRPDGKVIHVRGIGEITDAPDGRVLTGVVQDVTRQVERDNRLHLLDQSISRLNDVVLIFEAASGPAGADAPIVYVNPSFLRITGMALEDVLGQPISTVMLEAAPGVPLDVLVTAIANPVSLRSDIRLFARDGRIVPAEIDLVPVKGLTGKVTHWVAVVRDMSERDAAEALARANEERFQLLARSTHDVVWDYDLRKSLITWNDNFRKLAGNAQAPLTDAPSSWLDRLHPDDRARVIEGFYGAAASAADAWTDEYRFLRDDGNVRYVFDRGFISRDASGMAERIVGSMVDMTNQKLAEARLVQAEKLEALGQITGGVAHDFNNLLMVITGNAETLLERAEDPRERRLLELVFAAAERGRDLTGRLLAFARRIPLKPVVLELDDQVTRSAELFRRTFRSNIRIEMKLESGGARIESDPAQLELVLLNLAVNARDAMRDGGVLTFHTHVDRTGGQAQAALTISDTGDGMDDETLRRCLDPFFTTKQVGKGLGLGLSMAFGFMEQSGGTLQIASQPGRGTQVTLLFPETAKVQLPAPPPPVDAPMGRGEHILLVEDEPGVREHVERVLVSLGYRVTACESADAAIERVSEGTAFDLIFSDLIMPGTADVRELLKVARRLWPDIEMLYSSGYPRELVARDGRLATDIELLPKPYRKAELAVRLRAMLDRQAASRQRAVQSGGA